MWSREQQPDPADVVRGLRDQALTVESRDLKLSPGPGHQRVWGILMETGYAEAVATLVSLADGTTSLYFSNGGGMIGAGTQARVREAADQFIGVADGLVDEMREAASHPLPSVGRVRFYARTFNGLRTAGAGEQELAGGGHVLSPLFLAGHAVITAIRESGAGSWPRVTARRGTRPVLTSRSSRLKPRGWSHCEG